MKSTWLIIPVIAALASVSISPAAVAWQPDPQATIAAQKTAMTKLAMLDGQWRGPASMTLPDGSVHKFTQTERIGTLLDGSIRLIEGRSYDDAGHTVFNAFAVLSYDPAKQTYSMHSHAQGMVGDFAFEPTSDGYRWEIPAGPATIRYTAVVKGDHFVEIGERVVVGKPPVKFFTMELTRLGDSAWPAVDPVSVK